MSYRDPGDSGETAGGYDTVYISRTYGPDCGSPDSYKDRPGSL